jgi:2-amino-4-hydroxy-6-hydroxymethyldihydropteridine diphosphokinase/dihydropteroate synthase
MNFSSSSLRAWILGSRHARPSSSVSFTTTCASASHNAILSCSRSLATSTPKSNYTPTSSPHLQRRSYANFKRYTMDQSLVNDLKSQPRDTLLFRNGESNEQVPKKRTAYIALGSNLGDRVAMIERACREMDGRGIKVKRTSSLWETEPMYVLDQDRFVNGACEVCVLLHSRPCCYHSHMRL